MQISGYNCIIQERICSNKGSLLIYLNESYNYLYTVRSNIYKNSTIWEGQFIEVSGNGLPKKIIIGNVYRPPRNVNENIINFTTELTQALRYLKNSNSEVLIAGDFNITGEASFW